jgi:3-deoxy-D-arabino-heptulosonate 7-phosphate (DAHP) synthase
MGKFVCLVFWEQRDQELFNVWISVWILAILAFSGVEGRQTCNKRSKTLVKVFKGSQRHLLMHIHGCSIHNSQKLGTA